jgi:hypothetical protein
MSSSEVLSADEYKAKGNECFKEKCYHKAVLFYSKSLEQNLDPVVLSNRCQAYLALKYYEAALTDASESIRLNPDFVKSYYRRAQALTNLGIHSKARTDLHYVINLEPENKAAKELLLKLSITYDKPLVPIEIYDKNPYVRSTKPLVRIPILEKATSHDSGLSTPPSMCPSQDTTTSDFSSAVSVEDEPLPPPAETSTEFHVAFGTLKDNPSKFLEYFLSIPLSSFDTIFEPGVEPDWVETLLTALAEDYTGNDQILHSLEKLSSAPRFELCTTFLTDKMKADLKVALEKFSSDNNDNLLLVSKILKSFDF